MGVSFHVFALPQNCSAVDARIRHRSDSVAFCLSSRVGCIGFPNKLLRGRLWHVDQGVGEAQ